MNIYVNFYPMAYNIDGSTYIRLKDIGDIDNFNVSWDEATKTVIIDKTKDYVK